jgi:hypothetical protein
VVAVAAAVALFFAFAGDDGGADSATPQRQSARGTTETESEARSAPTQPQSAPETSGAEPEPPPAPRFERIVVRDGRPVGGVKRLEYERGERVRFLVRADMADEVHVHGFDITKDVPANRSVRFRFSADIEGVFEVELHHAHVTIAELRIGP